MRLDEIVENIEPIDQRYLKKAEERLEILTKPKDSLGKLEWLAKRIAGIQRNIKPIVEKKEIFLFASDHGVIEEGVSLYPKEVTSQMVFNFLKGGAAINVLAKHNGIKVHIVDIGVDYDFEDELGLIKKKIAKGTKNIRKGPAMSRELAIESLEIGANLALDAKRRGVHLIGTGDMGIGNTTPSSAITSVVTGRRVNEVTGPGTGLSSDALSHKVEVIEDAIRINNPDVNDGIDILSKVGGFEIGGIAGLILGAASSKMPVVIDGFISAAGATIAWKISPKVADYLIAGHLSTEKGQPLLLTMMHLEPVLDLNMRLGEGTGAALAIGIIEASVKIIRDMATFEEASVSKAIS